jgi:high-affinity K+ transport system ATPase subunit B
MSKGKQSLWQGGIVRQAILGSFIRLDPRSLWRNPVMLVVEGVSLIMTLITFTGRDSPVQPPDQPLALVHGPVRQFPFFPERPHSLLL